VTTRPRTFGTICRGVGWGGGVQWVQWVGDVGVSFGEFVSILQLLSSNSYADD
jgi:hypothetical protein